MDETDSYVKIEADKYEIQEEEQLKKYGFGVDVGGTTVKMGFFETSGNLLAFVSEAPDYELNENMVALYDFHTNPIKGKYQSVIFDKKAGIILCQKNSRQLINHLLKHKLILGAVLQKKLQKELGFYYRHTISLGEIAYFSLRAHSEKHTS